MVEKTSPADVTARAKAERLTSGERRESRLSVVSKDVRKEGRWRRSPGLYFKGLFSVSYSDSVGLETPIFF